MNLNHNGSLHNVLLANSSNTTAPVVGMGGTLIGWTDRHACTIVAVHGPDLVEVQQDRATRTDKLGMTDSGQQYSFAPNPDASRRLFKRDRKGWWRAAVRNPNGRTMFLDAVAGLQIGARSEHHDFSF